MKQAIVYGIARSGHNWMTNVVTSWKGSDWVVHGMESIWPWEFKETFCRDFKREEYPEWPVFILVRDYLNWAASWLKMTKGKEAENRDPERVMIWADRWMAIFQEATRVTDHIPNKLAINYDTFVADREYREIICAEMEGTYNEGILNFVPGTGSSFDGRFDMQGKGTQMKVLERWRWFLTEEGRPYQYHLGLRPKVMEYYLDYWLKYEDDDAKEKIHFCEKIMGKVYNNYF